METRTITLGTLLVVNTALAVGCLVSAGCTGATSGHEIPATLIEVTGKVKLDDAPLTSAGINFIPQRGTTGLGGYAVTDDTGSFKALHMSGATGLEPGNYDVTFSRIAMPDGSPIPEGKNATDVGARESLPPHLTQVRPEMHPYILTVVAGVKPVEFELKSKNR